MSKSKRRDEASDKVIKLIDESGCCLICMFSKDISCQESCTNDTKKCWEEYLLKGGEDES